MIPQAPGSRTPRGRTLPREGRELLVDHGDGSERGSATVVALGVIAGLSSLIVSALLLAGVLVATHRARAAADLAALSAAAVLMGADASGGDDATSAVAGDPCGRAAAVAQANHATVTRCVLEAASGGTEVIVETAVPLPSVVAALGPATGRARAGPPRAGAPADPLAAKPWVRGFVSWGAAGATARRFPS